MRHPILARRTTLAAYLLAWVPFGGLMAVLGRSQGWSWTEAVTLATAQTLARTAPNRPVWVLADRRDFAHLPDLQREAFELHETRGNQVVLSLR